MDTKKVGDSKNNGRELRPKGNPEPVRVHDFQIPELGEVAPYGVYDIAANHGWVSVGISADTQPASRPVILRDLALERSGPSLCNALASVTGASVAGRPVEGRRARYERRAEIRGRLAPSRDWRGPHAGPHRLCHCPPRGRALLLTA